MHLLISCSPAQKEELTATGLSPDADIIFVNHPDHLIDHPTDACIDLLFENTPSHINLLKSLPSPLIIVNSVISTLPEIDPSFVRINAWPTFLSSSSIEGSCLDIEKRKPAEAALALFNKKIEWLPDQPGFITPRIISMIINEAFFALSEGISTKEEMDTAMKLGTNYPFGPFEWAQKIGLTNISDLLTTLSRQQSRYTPNELIIKEASLYIPNSSDHQIH